MKHVLSIDVAKNKSMVLLISITGEILFEPHEINHNLNDFNLLHNKLISLNISDLTVFMESTSTYHLPVQRFFKEKNYTVHVINPIHAKNNTRNLRKTKTDKEDCYNLADLFFTKTIINNNLIKEDIYDNLNSLSRQLHSLYEGITRNKNRYIQLVNLTFPEFSLLFKKKAIYGLTAINFIKEFKHADIIKNKRVDALGHNMANTQNRHVNYYLKKATKIKEYASISYPGVSSKSKEVDNLIQIVDIISFEQKQIDLLQEKMITLAKQSSLFPIINSIFGIGQLSTSLILAELRDVTRFNNIKQINAYCGLDPTIIQSGKSVNYHGPISKRGNKYGRKILFNICVNIIKCSSRNNTDNSIYQYFRKKQSEGKHYYECITACSTKLIRIIFALCKSNSSFQ